MRQLTLQFRTALISAVLLLACAAVLVGVAFSPLSTLAESEAQARLQRIGDSVAALVQQALVLDIPLDKLVGVEALFEQRLAEPGTLNRLALLDAHAKLRWERRRVDASNTGSGTVVPLKTRSAVVVKGDVVATVEAQADAPTWAEIIQRWGPSVCAWIAGVVLVAAFLSVPRKRLQRDRWVAVATQRIAAGDFATRLMVHQHPGFDQRLPWLSARLRALREQHRRVLRLVQSLRQTEPDAIRRDALDLALVQAAGNAVFAEPAEVLVGSGAALSQKVSLKTRITLLMLLISVVLGAGFAAVLVQRDQVLSQRHHGSVLHAQSIAWTQGQSDAFHLLQEASRRLVNEPAWERAWRDQDKAGLADLVEKILVKHAGWRVDLFDDRRHLVYSSSLDVRQDALLDAGWVTQTLNRDDFVLGLSQVSRDRYYTVAASQFSVGQSRGVLALGLDTASLLPGLGSTLGGEASLLNLRGRKIAGSGHELMPEKGLSVSVRQAQVLSVKGRLDQHLLAQILPLLGPDERQVGALLVLRDVTQEYQADQRTAGWVGAVGVLFLLSLSVLVFMYLRRALAPLERSVDVLGALSQGDLRASLDDADEALPNEAGQIARGVAALRGEMLNLQMLRDERTRTRQQQEQLIRGQLKQLAESLDQEARAEVLSALDQKAAQNELAELAHILGRLSGLVTHQQLRLVGLLKELRAAMAQQAQFISLQQELEIARQMQLSILPRVTPLTPAVEVAAVMVPAKEIGGDFYDYFMLDAKHLAVVIADVSGKGVPAAFFMAISRTLLKANALFLREPAGIISQLNDQLCAENEQMMFVTVFLGILDLSTGELVFVNAGHNPPLLRHADGRVTALPHGRNMALAVMDGMPYVEDRCTLQVNDTLLLYTDGVTEATSIQGTLMGEPALIDVLCHHSGDNLALPDAVLKAVRDFESGAPQADDITCVSIRYRGNA